MDKFTNTPKEVDNYVEIINKQLYFAVLKEKQIVKLKNNATTLFFCIDDELFYENYYNDFGPLNISCLYKYSYKLKKYLQFAKGVKSVVHYTCDDSEKKTNAACLMGCFCVMNLISQPKEIWLILQELGPYKNFLDASLLHCGFNLKVPDVIQAAHKAFTYNFVDFRDFNVIEYDQYNKLQYGDINWILPRKFLAFIGPAANSGYPPEFYIKYFLRNDVKTVIRLNGPMYNAQVFTQLGIQHFDLVFPDGSTPPKDILLKFMTIVEMAPAAIAVHCKAGLGRTGCLIGAYIVKHYLMTAREAIGWMRLCRPGMVIGQQQLWLEKIENWLWKTGSQYRIHQYGADKIAKHKYGIYSREWPMERERIITEAKRKIQVSFNKTQMDKLGAKRCTSPSVDSLTRKYHQGIRKTTSSEKSLKDLLRVMMYPKSQNLESVIQKQWPKIPPKMQDESGPHDGKLHKKSDKNIVADVDRKKLGQNSQGDKLNKIKASWKNKAMYRPHLENQKFRPFMGTVS